MVSETLITSALSLIRSLCREGDGWEFDEAESISDDSWDADLLLVFRREDYVTCYVGVKNDRPLYVLQRIE